MTTNWTKPRHARWWKFANLVMHQYLTKKYKLQLQPFGENGRQYLILFNHVTSMDQFIITLLMKKSVYFLASEDLLSNGLISSFLRHALGLIPITKQMSDMNAIKNCLRVAKEGGTIAIAPEGNRTYSGKQCNINSTVARLAKTLKLPVALIRIEGGYGVEPRWSNVVRKGRFSASVVRIIEANEVAAMSSEALFDAIVTELNVNEAVCDSLYDHAQRAEYLERLFYVCPHCGLTTFVSHGDQVHCNNCGLTAAYLPTKEFKAISGEFPFRFVADWYEYQENFVHSLKSDDFLYEPMYAEKARFSEVILRKKKVLLCKEARIELYGNRCCVSYRNNSFVFPFAEVQAASVLGRNKLNIYYDGHVYQFKGGCRFNAVKYANMYYHYQIEKGLRSGKFLGF